jgi:hypothetical protein
MRVCDWCFLGVGGVDKMSDIQPCPITLAIRQCNEFIRVVEEMEALNSEPKRPSLAWEKLIAKGRVRRYAGALINRLSLVRSDNG